MTDFIVSLSFLVFLLFYAFLGVFFLIRTLLENDERVSTSDE